MVLPFRIEYVRWDNPSLPVHQPSHQARAAHPWKNLHALIPTPGGDLPHIPATFKEAADTAPTLVSHPVPARSRNPVMRTVLLRPPSPSIGSAWKTGSGATISLSRAMTPSRKPAMSCRSPAFLHEQVHEQVSERKFPTGRNPRSIQRTISKSCCARPWPS